jgi:hypothetical protein
MNYLYGLRWHDQLHQPIRPMSEKQARRSWEQGPQFCVAGGPDLAPGTVPDWSLVVGREGEFVKATRYDEVGRTVSVYTFRPQDGRPGETFLRSVTLYTYPDNEHWYSQMECSAVALYHFEPDGSGERRLKVKAAPADEVNVFEGVDVSQHWVPQIEWGDWDRFGQPREPVEGQGAPPAG